MDKRINHYGDCLIYALNCDICDCGEFRRIMPDIDTVDNETMEALIKHQVQVRSLNQEPGKPSKVVDYTTVISLIEKAEQQVRDLASGKKKWTMTVPVDAEYDGIGSGQTYHQVFITKIT